MPYAPKPKAKPAKIKVSQATIDRIKKLGMTAALKKAGTSKNAEYIEGIRRMYGERRLANARSTSASKAVSRGSLGYSTSKTSANKTSSAGGSSRNRVPMSTQSKRPTPKPAAAAKPKSNSLQNTPGVTRGGYLGSGADVQRALGSTNRPKPKTTPKPTEKVYYEKRVNYGNRSR